MVLKRRYWTLLLGMALVCAISGCLEEVPLPQAPQNEYTLGDKGNEVAGGAVGLPDGGFLIVGGSQEPGHSDYDLYIAKIDAAGREVFARRFGERDRDEIGWEVTATAGGQYAVIGTSRATSGGTSLVQISMLNADLELQWQTSNAVNIPNTGLRMRGVRFYQLADGHFIAGFATAEDPVILRFDDRGLKVDELVMQYRLGDEDDHLFTRNAQGVYLFFPPFRDWYTGQSQPMFYTFDASGALQDSVFMTLNQISYPDVKAVTGLRNGMYAATIYDLGSLEQVLVLFDSTGNVMRARGGSDFNYYNQLIELPDGKVLITGYDGLADSGFQPGNDFRFQLLDSLGTLVRSGAFGGQGTEQLHVVVPTPSGALLLGETASYGAGGTDLYFVFLND